MIYTQRPSATACAEFDLWTGYMGRRVRRGSKGIALLRHRDGRVFLRYVFDVADTVRLEHSRDPRPWQYRDEYQAAVTARLEEAFGVPGGDGLEKQLITLAVQFADEHWHDFKDEIIASVHDSLLDELDEDNVALRFCNAVTVSLSFLLLARCGFDLDSFFTSEDLACIGEFNTQNTVLALGSAVNESAGVILRQIEFAIRRQVRNPNISKNTAAGDEKPAAVPVSAPEPEAPSTTLTEQPQEAPEQLAIQEPPEPKAPVLEPVRPQQNVSVSPTGARPAYIRTPTTPERCS